MKILDEQIAGEKDIRSSLINQLPFVYELSENNSDGLPGGPPFNGWPEGEPGS